MARSTPRAVLTALVLAGIGLGAGPAGASPLQPTAQELGAFAMARALTLCFSTRQGMAPSRSRALAREILIRSGHDPDGAYVQVAAATEALADDLYRGFSERCTISDAYVGEAARRAARTFQGPASEPAKGPDAAPK